MSFIFKRYGHLYATFYLRQERRWRGLLERTAFDPTLAQRSVAYQFIMYPPAPAVYSSWDGARTNRIPRYLFLFLCCQPPTSLLYLRPVCSPPRLPSETMSGTSSRPIYLRSFFLGRRRDKPDPEYVAERMPAHEMIFCAPPSPCVVAEESDLRPVDCKPIPALTFRLPLTGTAMERISSRD